MEVLCKILAVCSLLVSAQAFVAVEPASSSELSWKSLFFDALVGNSNELQAAGSLSSLEECTAIYTVENIEVLLTAAYKIRRCINVEEKDIRRYLKGDDAAHTKKAFERELHSCSRRDCYVDSILNLFSSVRLNRHDYRRSRHCIVKEVEQALVQLDRASIVLANCLAEQEAPQNSTLPPPIWNTTLTTPSWNWNNTTSGPNWNTTEWPWWNNTTAGPNWNSTEGPWWGNTTSRPNWNSTEGPWWGNTTSRPNWNSTEGPWWGNTTARPNWNSTEGPWWGNTTSGPNWNSTEGPWWGNTTSGPNWNTTQWPNTNTTPNWTLSTPGPNWNTTQGPWGNSTTLRPNWNTTVSEPQWNSTTRTPQWNRTTTDEPQWNATTTTELATTEGNWWDKLMKEVGSLF